MWCEIVVLGVYCLVSGPFVLWKKRCRLIEC